MCDYIYSDLIKTLSWQNLNLIIGITKISKISSSTCISLNNNNKTHNKTNSVQFPQMSENWLVSTGVKTT